jgi:hypothetical protein
VCVSALPLSNARVYALADLLQAIRIRALGWLIAEA